jgi:uncharacterized membrane protein YdbT with pleckstrin-like domain
VARYADTLLADGERIALRTRQHWLAPVVDARGPWAIFVVSVVVLVLAGMATGDVRNIVGWIGLGGLVVSLVLLGHRYWAWLAQDYIVTNRRVLKVEGIINKRSADSSLEKINDAVLDQNIFGRIFGYGDLDILTAADTAIDRYRMLRDAPGFKKAMLDEKHRLDLEMVRGTAPAMRAATSRTMSPDEVTKALGDLADLRDRGALSADEYEAKKADLLSRL